MSVEEQQVLAYVKPRMCFEHPAIVCALCRFSQRAQPSGEIICRVNPSISFVVDDPEHSRCTLREARVAVAQE